MKKLLRILFLLALIVGLVFGTYLYLSLFPKAEPLQYPDAESVSSVSVAKNRAADAVTLSAEDRATMLGYIESAEPTRKQSLNDSPYVTPYYRVALATEERTYIYYVYEEDGRTYLESPYEGIYRIEGAAIDLLASYCSK